MKKNDLSIFFNNILIYKKTLYLLLFLVIFSYFLWLNNMPVFSDPDSFYHAKMINLISRQGIIHNFFWLPFTTLNDIYIDHHLLYHLLLVPFSLFINSLFLVKLSAVLFASFFILLFQWLLDKFKIKYSFIYTLILLTSYQFIFRLNLAKVPALSLIVLLLFIYILFTKNKKWSWLLFLLSFIYVWLYGAWIIGLFLIGLYVLLENLFNYLNHQKQNYKFFLSSFIGFIAGLVINPYFPTNFKFYWQQTFQIGLVNYKNIVGVGGEWYGLSIFDFIQHNLIILILFLLASLVLIFYKNKYHIQHWFLFITSFVFFVLTLKSQRVIEYFVPLVLLFIALVFNEINIKEQINKFIKIIPYSKIILSVFTILLLLYLPVIFLGNYQGLKTTLGTNYNFTTFKDSMVWLINNTQPNEIIFHDRWDDWPVFFYYNSYNRYVIGLDPTFMYFKDKNKYNNWRQIKDGKIKNPCLLIHREFTSQYIFIKKGNQLFKNNVNHDQHCILAYQGQDGSIYKIINF